MGKNLTDLYPSLSRFRKRYSMKNTTLSNGKNELEVVHDHELTERNKPMLDSSPLQIVRQRMAESLEILESILWVLFHPIILYTSNSNLPCENCKKEAETNLEYRIQTSKGIICSDCLQEFKKELDPSVKHCHI
jgi:hypothetical protein